MYGFTRLYLRTSQIKADEQQQIQKNQAHLQTCIEFDTIEAMLDHVTLNWMDHFVTCDVNSVEGIAILRKRPFFLLLSVESPMMTRFRRSVARCKAQGQDVPTLETFVEMTDASLYNASSSHFAIASDSPLSLTPSILLNRTSQLQQPTAVTVSLLHSDTTRSGDSTPSIPDQDSAAVSPIQYFNSPPYKLLSMSDLSILNHYANLSCLRTAIEALDITNPDLLRPSWDSYFMYLANLAARRSNCMKRRVGCVLVRERRVIATGYNGTPKNLTNCNEGGCSRCNQATPCGKGLDRCLCMHAEENALLEAGRERVGKESTIYCNTCPCLGCAIKIVQVGVSEVVYSESYGMDDLTAEVFRNAGVILRQHATPGIKLDQSNP
ncbi:Deoxycytidine monophosphate (dCMP) deaminase [Linnemannia exigua]|uniref:Deoxycytidylate deaminase n=1 Tax=Linnemannia exigua TaxID=604196 RepID=A0AAD4DF76_9FUNG|nr:Deoxycytidine monophosphate (dCMP) deaminase [Linnemannia exigua]